jgi:phosphate starvation-inducible PhoH-like protein
MDQILNVDRLDRVMSVFGSFDENIKVVEKELGVSVLMRETDLKISGEPENVATAAKVVEGLLTLSAKGEPISPQNVKYVLSMVRDGREDMLSKLASDVLCITAKGKPVKGKTLGQNNYIDLMRKNTVTFAIGPAGTGKTYLAVAAAVKALRAHEVSRIVLTRPAVEAGERLGFLPGDLQSKIDPYLRPLYDALYEMLGAESCARMIEKMTIEIAPLAYMRGRTLDDSFIILDEAQNTTPEQMKMFLTRLGFNSKAVVTGDVTQTDLPAGKRSGLLEATKILKDIEGIAIHNFTERDVVRHRLVQKIILAYDKYDKERKEKNEKERTRRFYKQ